MSKQPRSFSLDEDIADILSERDDINASAVVNQFLRQYLAGGDSEEAALRIRLEQLDSEIADVEKELTQLKRERDRVQSRLDERQSKLDEVLDEAVAKVVSRKGLRETTVPDGGLFRDQVTPDNPVVQRWASEAGVPIERFIDKLEARL